MPNRVIPLSAQVFRRNAGLPQHGPRAHGPLIVLTRPRFIQRTSLQSRCLRRSFAIGALPAVLIPPAVFAGLVVALWVWKCMMMIVFQNKIIYMPFLPPNARQETLADYARRCSPVEWHEQRIKVVDGTEIVLCIGHAKPSQAKHDAELKDGRHVVILYFQGYAYIYTKSRTMPLIVS